MRYRFKNKSNQTLFIKGFVVFCIPYLLLAFIFGWELYPMGLITSIVGGFLFVIFLGASDKSISMKKIHDAREFYTKGLMDDLKTANEKYPWSHLKQDTPEFDKQFDLFIKYVEELRQQLFTNSAKKFKLSDSEMVTMQNAINHDLRETN